MNISVASYCTILSWILGLTYMLVMQEFISKMTFFWETMLRWYCLWYKMYLSLVPSPHMHSKNSGMNFIPTIEYDFHPNEFHTYGMNSASMTLRMRLSTATQHVIWGFHFLSSYIHTTRPLLTCYCCILYSSLLEPISQHTSTLKHVPF